MEIPEVLPFSIAPIAVLVPGLLFLAACLYLWKLRWDLKRDRDWELPLPPGSMGLPLVGETFHWLLQGSDFHASRRKKYGNVFRTHLLGQPVVRVTGAEHVRRLLLSEHNLVSAQWPRSTQELLGQSSLANSIGDIHRCKRKVYARVFSHDALESYLPRIKEVVAETRRSWIAKGGPISVYPESKRLMFRIAVSVLLGFTPTRQEFNDLFANFEQLADNIFSLPLDVPGSGYRKGLQARDRLHQYIEKATEFKLQSGSCKGYSDALNILMESRKEHDMEISMQELKEATVELMFAACASSASASTSLILQLMKNPGALAKLRRELQANCVPDGDFLHLREISRMHYLDCVVQEVLRILPPVSGGYRIALQTFDLGGYQIPKGWSVLYSIRDTHDTAPIFPNPEIFNPDRFAEDQMKGKGERFQYLPFGGGVRSCLGKELAKLTIKVLAIELASTSHWELATKTCPRMLTVPVVHPDDGLKVHFQNMFTIKNVSL
ncbi:cytochrome P450 26B1-like [Callorhinchus milii]|uniref:cytochrome P450 26B1-like n=1 Tax=Callorhinchus milii TaxID=7868 RepID=UPI0004575210|nr:cytochrome P450 26B1-like [Callorhinchus milii]|eukprot:gi/632948632/ref/XP_007889701.1/ PREDICTED: cytochrome P450 26B1-like [Callorhinchus milii]